MNYDLAGRKISMSDPDLGNWSYTYDRLNQLISQTDGRGKTICLYYNTIEQLIGKRFPGTATCPTTGAYAVSYTYDQNPQ
ncbi:MAG: RHS repeat domain-containing protein [Caldilineaceae bacterium]